MLWLAIVGIDPVDRRPGTRLSGTLQALPQDWSFTDAVQEVQVQTHPWWGVPYSVTVVLARDGQTLYSPSIYSEPAAFPGTKFWNRIIAANPDVLLRVGENLYPLRLRPAASPSETAAGLNALAAKYPFWQRVRDDPAAAPAFVILRYEPR